jgi:hypothetical protein
VHVCVHDLNMTQLQKKGPQTMIQLTWDLYVENVSAFKRIQSMTTDWLIFFLGGGWYLLWRQRKGLRKKYHIQMLVYWLFFSVVHICDNMPRIQTRRNIRTLGNLTYTRCYANWYRSGSLVFRCSFYQFKWMVVEYSTSAQESN